MALDIVASCATAAQGSDTPGLAVFLTILFASYIAVDSVLAASVIVRKAAEAEAVTASRM